MAWLRRDKLSPTRHRHLDSATHKRVVLGSKRRNRSAALTERAFLYTGQPLPLRRPSLWTSIFPEVTSDSVAAVPEPVPMLLYREVVDVDYRLLAPPSGGLDLSRRSLRTSCVLVLV